MPGLYTKLFIPLNFIFMTNNHVIHEVTWAAIVNIVVLMGSFGLLAL